MSEFGRAVVDDPQGESGEPMTEDEIARRIAVIRELVDLDPMRIEPLLRAVGTGLHPVARISPHAPTTLALLDELETLVGLLAERRAQTMEELQACRQRRRALHAYLPRPAAT